MEITSNYIQTVFSVLGSHIVEVYFNHVYKSVQANLNKDTTEKDEYIRQVNTYILGVKTDIKSYQETVKMVHIYFQKHTSYGSITYLNFLEKIVALFVPQKYHIEMNSQQKSELVQNVIITLISELGAYVTKPETLTKITTNRNHNPQKTIKELQNVSMEVLTYFRETIQNKFIEQTGESKPRESNDIVNSLKTVVVRLTKEKTQLKIHNERLNADLQKMEIECAELKKAKKQFIKLLKKQTAQKEIGLRNAAYLAAIPPQDVIGENPLPPTNPEMRKEPISPQQKEIANTRRGRINIAYENLSDAGTAEEGAETGTSSSCEEQTSGGSAEENMGYEN